MHEAIERLQELTANLVRDLPQATVDDIESFISERGLLVERLSGLNLTGDAYRQASNCIKEVLSHDPVIIERMNALRDEAAQGLSKFNNARMQRSAYEVGDSYSYNESLFFDSKK
ncbi:hypothetical protein [Paenibacillus contaminans]|uniref:Flagellar protein FliT n=1 Tax=Paenibacillus contaminans TaxID=450362 RepID=A0A329MIK2_9BACL|nr:hypothetical protein [Paenibacillus contaminans]RAV17407.1 hypothetical protein DQG23_27595 [Paenibacillus contaminans]